MQSAERISRERSDNFVFRRSQLAYIEAARMVHGDVLEVGTGTGYGIEIIAPHVRSLTTVDKHRFDGEALSLPNVRFVRTVVPRLPFADRSFDFVVSFQVIEHIRRDGDFVREVHRVLRPGGAFVVTTPNAPMSLTRNPWHVREYDADALAALLGGLFDRVDRYGVSGNGKGYGVLCQEPPRGRAYRALRPARSATPPAAVDAAPALRYSQPSQPQTSVEG